MIRYFVCCTFIISIHGFSYFKKPNIFHSSVLIKIHNENKNHMNDLNDLNDLNNMNNLKLNNLTVNDTLIDINTKNLICALTDTTNHDENEEMRKFMLYASQKMSEYRQKQNHNPDGFQLDPKQMKTTGKQYGPSHKYREQLEKLRNRKDINNVDNKNYKNIKRDATNETNETNETDPDNLDEFANLDEFGDFDDFDIEKMIQRALYGKSTKYNNSQPVVNDIYKPSAGSVRFIRLIPIVDEEMDERGIPKKDKEEESNQHDDSDYPRNLRRQRYQKSGNDESSSLRKKSKNFEVIEGSNYTFENVGGNKEVKRKLLQCVDFFQNSEKYAKYNVKPRRGILLTGPPGNGKTLLMKAFCGVIGASFIETSGSIFQEKYVGVGPSKVRELFELANDAKKPCIIFIDEMDAVGRKRSSDLEGSSSERDSTLNELLVRMDGFKEYKDVFVVGATNRDDVLDPALLRRFNSIITVPNPDQETRADIISIHIQGKPYSNEVNILKLVMETSGLSGANIENVLNEAMLNALQENREFFDLHDLNLALTNQLFGEQAVPNSISRKQIYHICVHEIGHAIMGYVSKQFAPLVSVRINLNAPNVPGSTHFENIENDAGLKSKEYLIEQIGVCLAGLCAEELFFDSKHVLSGSSSDIEKASQIAKLMITTFGMSQNGKIYYGHSNSDQEAVDREIAKIINDIKGETMRVLKKYYSEIEEMAHKLANKGILQRSDFEHIERMKHF